MSYNPNQNYNQGNRGGGGGGAGGNYQPQYQQSAPNQPQQNFNAPRQGFVVPDPRQQQQQGSFGRPAHTAAPFTEEWNPYNTQDQSAAYNPRYQGAGAGYQPAGYSSAAPAGSSAGYNNAPMRTQASGIAAAAATPSSSTAVPVGNSMSNIKLTLAQTISNLAAAAASASASSTGAGAGAGAGGYVNAGGNQDYNPSYGSNMGRSSVPQQQQQYSPHMTGVAGNRGAYNAQQQQQQQQQVIGRNPDVANYALRHAPLTVTASATASPALRGQSAIMPIDVRYRPQSTAGVAQNVRYNAAPAADSIGRASSGNPPNTGGFYNRRPENTMQPPANISPRADSGSMQQNRSDFMYDSRVSEAPYTPHTHQLSTQPQQMHGYVNPVATGTTSRSGYAPPVDTQQHIPYSNNNSNSIQHHRGAPIAAAVYPNNNHSDAPFVSTRPTLSAAPASAMPMHDNYRSNDYSSTRHSVQQQQYQPQTQQMHPAVASTTMPLTRWSPCLMDPLDVSDGLLENSLRRGHNKPGQTQQTHATNKRANPAVRESRDLSHYGNAAAAAAPHSSSNKRTRSDHRSASPIPALSRRRSRSRSRSDSRHPSRSRSISTSRPLTTTATAAGPDSGGGVVSPSMRRSSGLPYGARPSRPLAYGTTPVVHFIQEFHLPAVNLNNRVLNVLDLYTKFPRLYIPNDFVQARVDGDALSDAINSDVFCDLINTVPISLESNNPTQLSSDNSVRVHAVQSDILDIPKFTCTENIITANDKSTVAQFADAVKPVKHQVRVLVCCGMRNPDDERIDHNLPQKLRVLCGRRKGSYQLLGCPWSRELDSSALSDPNETPFTNSSCLVRTAQRALLAQALLHMPVRSERTSMESGADVVRYSAEGLVPLCEVQYHRPAEEVKGKTFPEQIELTTIFLYTIQPSLLSALSDSDFKLQHRVMTRRVQGVCPGPLLNSSVEEWVSRLQEIEKLCGSREEETAIEGKEGVCESSAGEIGDPQEEAQTKETSASELVAAASETESEKIDAKTVMDTSNGVNSDDTIAAELAETVSDVQALSEPTAAVCDAKSSDNSTVTATTAIAALSHAKHENHEPTAPSLFLCPMPLSTEAAQDAAKKQDALSLRLIPLHSLLTYSQDDRSERLFETSLAAEILKSMMSVSYANTITDFVLSENPALNSVCDLRVMEATSTLRRMLVLLKGKTTQQQAINTTKSDITAASAKPNISNGHSSQPFSPTITSSADATDGGDVAVGGDSGNMDQVEEAVEVQKEEEEEKKEEEKEEEKDEQKEEEEEDLDEVEFHVDYQPSANIIQDFPDETQDNTAADAICSATEHKELFSEVDVDKCTEHALSDDEARNWRRRFVSAARWFDTTEELCLHYEHLKMILHSSNRYLSRADVEEALERVCKNDILRYETFI
eukprot:CAMPEP_0170382124 /NCGR_PEP_ID=MMETSP0117_2-20130122/14777_1 /TAXON_ID=400756 /ORGANISM="Durinskia baltica, Strain CSIRO CS-38" /LENGTH=1404 /DNA_ID=CAMNT_0010637745 /DNA_START=85 /DNA_END=4299 /DNA_ORIENTATION=+